MYCTTLGSPCFVGCWHSAASCYASLGGCWLSASRCLVSLRGTVDSYTLFSSPWDSLQPSTRCPASLLAPRALGGIGSQLHVVMPRLRCVGCQLHAVQSHCTGQPSATRCSAHPAGARSHRRDVLHHSRLRGPWAVVALSYTLSCLTRGVLHVSFTLFSVALQGGGQSHAARLALRALAVFDATIFSGTVFFGTACKQAEYLEDLDVEAGPRVQPNGCTWRQVWCVRGSRPLPCTAQRLCMAVGVVLGLAACGCCAHP